MIAYECQEADELKMTQDSRLIEYESLHMNYKNKMCIKIYMWLAILSFKGMFTKSDYVLAVSY